MFNLSSSFEPIGIFYLGNEQIYCVLRLLFPTRGLIVLLTGYKKQDDFFITGAIFNISNPQVKKKYSIE